MINDNDELVFNFDEDLMFGSPPKTSAEPSLEASPRRTYKEEKTPWTNHIPSKFHGKQAPEEKENQSPRMTEEAPKGTPIPKRREKLAIKKGLATQPPIVVVSDSDLSTSSFFYRPNKEETNVTQYKAIAVNSIMNKEEILSLIKELTEHSINGEFDDQKKAERLIINLIRIDSKVDAEQLIDNMNRANNVSLDNAFFLEDDAAEVPSKTKEMLAHLAECYAINQVDMHIEKPKLFWLQHIDALESANKIIDTLAIEVNTEIAELDETVKQIELYIETRDSHINALKKWGKDNFEIDLSKHQIDFERLPSGFVRLIINKIANIIIRKKIKPSDADLSVLNTYLKTIARLNNTLIQCKDVEKIASEKTALMQELHDANECKEKHTQQIQCVKYALAQRHHLKEPIDNTPSFK